MNDDDRDDDDVTEEDEMDFSDLRLLVETHAQLAAVLGVTRPAIYRAEQTGRITRDDDGAWSVLDVVTAWRDNTNPLLQRRTLPDWLDGETPLTAAVVMQLVARTREQGGTVLEDDDAGQWRPVPPIPDVLRTGSPLSWLSNEELAGHVSAGEWWYSWSLRVAPALASTLGLADAEPLRKALHALMREALAMLAESPGD
jgi:hypothetical protein